ncbi:hypothetical protein [Porphyromonas sp.]|uniref:hypothetical protein n=1 Tax=Porphyromonas sp. TaxID=1924944 RepID=UPI0026DBD51F|nr:hypothetical protein [Porphyromonas sp.]MDO4770640.1 hypothetical protein [Porphyromonas sp.]
MNKIFHAFALSLLALSVVSCYKDQSSLQTTPTPEITITVEDVDKEIHIDGEEILTIQPKVSAPQGAELTYKWELSRKAGDYEKDMEVISTDLALKDYKVTRPTDSSTPYYLRYTVTNKSFGDVETILLWKLYVSPVLSDGLLFSYTKDGKTSDLGYIKSQEFTRDYIGGKQIILTGLYEKVAGNAWDGLIKALSFSVKGNVYFKHTPYAWAVTADHKLLRFDPLNYSLDGSSDRNDLMMVEEESPKVLQFSHNSSNIFIRTEKRAYRCPSNALNFFSEPIEGWDAETVSGDITAAHGCLKDRGGIVWYNSTQGMFKTLDQNSVTTFKKSEHFDPNILPNQEAITAATTIEGPRKEPGKSLFLLKDQVSQEYNIYELDLTPSHDLQADRKYSLSGEAKALLDRRVDASFAVRQPVLYVATQDGIHVINWKGDGTTSVNTAAFLSLAKFGKVKSIRFYRQGEWIIQPHRALFKLSEYNEAALIAVTETSDGNDQIHFIPMATDNTASLGALQPESEIRTFSPKVGKILDVIPMGK